MSDKKKSMERKTIRGGKSVGEYLMTKYIILMKKDKEDFLGAGDGCQQLERAADIRSLLFL